MNIFQLTTIISSKENTMDYMRDHGLLRKGQFCEDCYTWMELQTYTQRKLDGYTWRCPTCRARKSIRTASFFDEQKMTLPKVLMFLYMFSMNMSITVAAEFCNAEISPRSLIDWYNLFRDLMSRYMVDHPLILDGNRVEVEIDESLWRGKRKYN